MLGFYSNEYIDKIKNICNVKEVMKVYYPLPSRNGNRALIICNHGYSDKVCEYLENKFKELSDNSGINIYPFVCTSSSEEYEYRDKLILSKNCYAGIRIPDRPDPWEHDWSDLLKVYGNTSKVIIAPKDTWIEGKSTTNMWDRTNFCIKSITRSDTTRIQIRKGDKIFISKFQLYINKPDQTIIHIIGDSTRFTALPIGEEFEFNNEPSLNIDHD